jgi:FkbM family methyltransferase
MISLLKDKKYLEGLLSISEVEARIRALSQFGDLPERPLLLFGAGYLGKLTQRRLAEIGRSGVAFVDNNQALWGTQVERIIVLGPEEALQRYGTEAVFLVTVFTSTPVISQLRALGVPVLPYSVMAWAHPEAMLPLGALDLPGAVLTNSAAVQQGLEYWADETSRKEYLGQIAWRTTLDPATLPPHLPQEQIYFADDLFDLGTDEVVVDCGAFDGDTLRAVLGRTQSFTRYLAAEPDSANRIRLEATIQNLDPSLRPHCSILPYAVGDRSGSIRFHQTGTAGSSISDAGSLDIPIEPLDHLLEGVNPTFIKMDIEGAELVALSGARKVIQRAMPILAICLYHRPTDLWEIPKLIKEIAPGYQLFLRRYCDDLWEQVCYAVPPGRLKGTSVNPES